MNMGISFPFTGVNVILLQSLTSANHNSELSKKKVRCKNSRPSTIACHMKKRSILFICGLDLWNPLFPGP